MKTQKEILLKGIRKGDFAAFLALRDLAEEMGEHRLQRTLQHFLDTAKWHTTTKKKFRCGLSESLRRWLRETLVRINRLEKCWKLGGNSIRSNNHNHPLNVDDKLYEWQMTLTRHALAYYRSIAEPQQTE